MRITTHREQFAMTNPWLREALDLADDAKAPGHRGGTPSGYGVQSPRTDMPSPESAPWVGVDWRTAQDYGHFNSTSRPPMSSDVPHPSEVLDPNNPKHTEPRQYPVTNSKTKETVLYHLPSWMDAHKWGMQTDPDRDPYGVMHPYTKVEHLGAPDKAGNRTVTDISDDFHLGNGVAASDLSRNNLDHHDNQTPEQAYKGRHWYRAGHEGTKDLSDKTIGDHERAVHVMSAYSPKTEWDENLEKGHHFLTHYSGDPNDPTGTGDPKAQITPGLQSPVAKAIEIYHAHPDDISKINSGEKTSAFASNLLDKTPLREPREGHDDDSGYYQHPINPHTGEPDFRMHSDPNVTVDTHDVRMKLTPHGDQDAMRAMKYGTPPIFEARIPGTGGVRPGYDLYARATAEATHAANLREPDPNRHLVHKQLQAGPWGKFKDDLNVANNKTVSDVGEAPGGLTKQFDMKKNRGRDHDEIEQEWAEKNPLKNPIPRWQRDRGDFWTDKYRRPEMDNVRETPGWGNRSPVGRPPINEQPHNKRGALLVKAAGSLMDQWMNEYVSRNPHHMHQDRDPHLAAYEAPEAPQAYTDPAHRLGAVQGLLADVDRLLGR